MRALVVGGAIIIAGVAISQWQQGEETEKLDEKPESMPEDNGIEARVALVPSRPDIKNAVERLVASSKEAQRLK